jgi:hypothetical protein
MKYNAVPNNDKANPIRTIFADSITMSLEVPNKLAKVATNLSKYCATVLLIDSKNSVDGQKLHHLTFKSIPNKDCDVGTLTKGSLNKTEFKSFDLSCAR